MATRKLRERGERTRSAEETLARVSRHFGPLGITRVADVTGLDCIGIPVVMVCRPNARSLSLSQGKGVTLASARTSGVMEAIELYHAERIVHPLKLATWNDMRFSHAVVPVEGLPRTGLSQFGPNVPLLWIEGVDITRERSMWLPFELVHVNLTMPFPSGTGCFVLSSNGLASGNHRLEAVIHALCEVVERDAATLFLSRQEAEQRRRRIDLTTVCDRDCLELLAAYERAGVAVGLWDMTSDVGIAAVRAVIVDRDQNTFRPVPPAEGFGCHPVREVAAARALSEAAQARLTLITGSRDDNLPHLFSEGTEAGFMLRTRKELSVRGERAFTSLPTRENLDLEADLSTVLHGLKQAGLEQVIVVDLTKPGIDVPVVRVVVPGLEPYHGVSGGRGGKRVERLQKQLAGALP